MKYIIYSIIVVISLSFSGCFEEDERVVPIPIEEIEIPYSMYEYQTYYSISEQSIVSYHNYTDWDLGFESSNEGYHIILNYARFMYAGNTYKTDFKNVKSNIAAEMTFDSSTGDLDSTVFNDWVDLANPGNPNFNEYVYVVDRGRDESGQEFGFKKIVFEKVENDTFYVHYANLDNTEEHYYKIPKDTTTNFTLFSLEGAGDLKVTEPDKNTWDLCFTKYSTIIPDDNGVPTDYLVRGVFLNPNKSIEVAVDTVNHFYEILPDMAYDYDYSNARDAIGYNWKVFKDNYYEIIDNRSFVLKNIDGIEYKLRFTRFYNDLGEKGYPAFELMEL